MHVTLILKEPFQIINMGVYEQHIKVTMSKLFYVQLYLCKRSPCEKCKTFCNKAKFSESK